MISTSHTNSASAICSTFSADRSLRSSCLPALERSSSARDGLDLHRLKWVCTSANHSGLKDRRSRLHDCLGVCPKDDNFNNASLGKTKASVCFFATVGLGVGDFGYRVFVLLVSVVLYMDSVHRHPYREREAGHTIP